MTPYGNRLAEMVVRSFHALASRKICLLCLCIQCGGGEQPVLPCSLAAFLLIVLWEAAHDYFKYLSGCAFVTPLLISFLSYLSQGFLVPSVTFHFSRNIKVTYFTSRLVGFFLSATKGRKKMLKEKSCQQIHIN